MSTPYLKHVCICIVLESFEKLPILLFFNENFAVHLPFWTFPLATPSVEMAILSETQHHFVQGYYCVRNFVSKKTPDTD